MSHARTIGRRGWHDIKVRDRAYRRSRGDGLMLLDPNGDFAEFALGLVPPQRANHVCYLNLADTGFPVGFNVLEDVEPDTRDVLASSIVSAFMHIWPDAFSPSAERILLHAVTALVEA